MTAAQPSRQPSIKRYLEHPRGGPTVLRIVLGTQLRPPEATVRVGDSFGIADIEWSVTRTAN